MALNVNGEAIRVVKFNNAEETNRWLRSNAEITILDIKYSIASSDVDPVEGILVIYQD